MAFYRATQPATILLVIRSWVGSRLRGQVMADATVMIHCDQCGVSSPRDVSEFVGDLDDLRCRSCGAKLSQDALIQAKEASKVIIVRAKHD
jgi:ribosomal protein S26